MTLNPLGYGCPRTASPTYWDDNCATYEKLANYDYNCLTCTGTSLKIIVPSDVAKNKCLTPIADCSSYLSSGDCEACLSG